MLTQDIFTGGQLRLLRWFTTWCWQNRSQSNPNSNTISLQFYDQILELSWITVLSWFMWFIYMSVWFPWHHNKLMIAPVSINESLRIYVNRSTAKHSKTQQSANYVDSILGRLKYPCSMKLEKVLNGRFSQIYNIQEMTGVLTVFNWISSWSDTSSLSIKIFAICMTFSVKMPGVRLSITYWL